MRLSPFRPRPGTPPHPKTVWREGALFNADFADIYASRADGLAETKAVFLAGCDLPQAWAGREQFTIGETGFGAGLNFLALWDLWRTTRPPHAIMHFLTIEGFPLAQAEARAVHALYPELAPLSEALCARWPVSAYGLQRLWFPGDRIALTLSIGPVPEALGALGPAGVVDAWFLDGFAPSRNPDMWSPAVFAEIARLSAPAARAATYSVAGKVREGLAEIGFAVAKAPGFAGKKARLSAARGAPAAIGAARAQSAIVIGAGIAGAACAFALRRRGLDVTAIHSSAVPAASGNPAGLVHPRLDAVDTPARRLHLSAFFYAIDLYRALGPEIFSETGVGIRAARPSEAERFRKLAADPPLGPDHLAFGEDVLRFAKGGIVHPTRLIERLLEGVSLHDCAVIATIAPAAGRWRAVDHRGAVLAEADRLVLAPGAAPNPIAALLPLERIGGQVDWARFAGPAPEEALAGDAYAVPLGPQTLLYGATYDRLPPEMESAEFPTSLAASTRNRQALARSAPALAARLGDALGARASVRAAFADQMPALGFIQADGLADAFTGAVALLGLGSRGFTLGPLLGEAAAALLLDEPSPLEPVVAAALSLHRFAERAARRHPSRDSAGRKPMPQAPHPPAEV